MENEGRLFTSVVEDDIAYTLYLIERIKRRMKQIQGRTVRK